MGARLATSMAMIETMPRQGESDSREGKSSQQPKNGIGKRSRSTARLPRCLIQVGDIQAAIAWRLSGIPAGDVAALALVLLPLVADFREDRPEVAAVLRDLHYPGDRRGAWSLACAVLADDAGRRRDWPIFWAAGFEVAKSLQQGKRGSHANRQATHAPDALDTQIAEYLGNQPGLSPDVVFGHFADMAGAVHEVLADFDSEKDELVCQLDPSDETLLNISRDEFTRRVIRAKRDQT